CQHESDWSLAF
nr:immunoglobulin light chain junction region [Macaca mulatta]